MRVNRLRHELNFCIDYSFKDVWMTEKTQI